MRTWTSTCNIFKNICHLSLCECITHICFSNIATSFSRSVSYSVNRPLWYSRGVELSCTEELRCRAQSSTHYYNGSILLTMNTSLTRRDFLHQDSKSNIENIWVQWKPTYNEQFLLTRGQLDPVYKFFALVPMKTNVSVCANSLSNSKTYSHRNCLRSHPKYWDLCYFIINVP